MPMTSDYELLDSGDAQKLERWGEFFLARPSSIAVWQKKHPELWEKATATFSRKEQNRWEQKNQLPESWHVKINRILFLVKPTDFGHLGVFPEHQSIWQELAKHIKNQNQPKVLNLFAYTGGASIAAAKSGAFVCHVDASRPSIDWAKENAKLNHLASDSIRWIEDDARKFLKREAKRKNYYDGIILDPPTFGRGSKNEVFKIEEDIVALLQLCKEVLSKNPLFVAFTTHTLGFTPTVLHNLLDQVLGKGTIKESEMLIRSISSFDLPCGYGAIWTPR